MHHPRPRFISAVAAAALVLLTVARVNAAIVFDNFGPSNGYRNYGTWFGTYPELFASSVEATKFTPSQDGFLYRLTTAMWLGSPRNEITLSLRADDNDQPGQTLWQQTFVNKLASYGSVAVFDQLNGPQLSASTPYWLVVTTPDDGVTHHLWYDGVVSGESTARRPVDSGTWRVYDGYEGRGTRVEVVPEPATLALGTLALFPPLMSRRRRPKAVRARV